MQGLFECCNKWCEKVGANSAVMENFLNKVKEELSKRMNNYKVKYSSRNKCSLTSPKVKRVLCNIHEKFVVVPMDKATGNIAIICKRFYATILCEELGLTTGKETQVYDKILNRIPEYHNFIEPEAYVKNELNWINQNRVMTTPTQNRVKYGQMVLPLCNLETRIFVNMTYNPV